MEVTHKAFLLVGRTGNGKSSTGNSILNKKTFKARGSSTPTIDDVILDTATIDGQTITVVDGPSFGDDSLDTPQHVQSTLKMAEKAMSLGSHGFSAVVIVLKYGIRYTKQESDAINAIKSFFGKDVVKKYGVIVWTHGDSFELDTEDEDTSFEAWCRDQTGNIADLLQECEYRCVLFNNRSEDEDKGTAQYSSLMDMVDKIQAGPYTEDNFRRAEPDRRAILVRSKLPQLESETRQFLDGINSRLEQLGKSGYQGHVMYSQLENLKTDVENRMCHLKRQYGDTDELRSLFLELDSKITLVNMLLRVARDEQRARDKQRAKDEQRARDEQRAKDEQRARDELRARKEQWARDEQRAKDEQRTRDEQRAREEQQARDEQRAKDEQRARDEQVAREEQRARFVDSKVRLSMAQKLESETRQFLDGINSQLEQLEKSGHIMLPQLENLKTDVKNRVCDLKRQYGETDELRSLLLELQVVEQTVDTKITLVNMQLRAARDEQRVNDEQRAREKQRAKDEQPVKHEQRAKDEQRSKYQQRAGDEQGRKKGFFSRFSRHTALRDDSGN